MSDVHTDLEYEPGAQAKCNAPDCCRKESKPAVKNENEKAGYWGSLADCDIPQHTFD